MVSRGVNSPPPPQKFVPPPFIAWSPPSDNFKTSQAYQTLCSSKSHKNNNYARAPLTVSFSQRLHQYTLEQLLDLPHINLSKKCSPWKALSGKNCPYTLGGGEGGGEGEDTMKPLSFLTS